MRIGLLGFEFAADNLGCEALTFSLLTLLRPSLGASDITFRSFEMSGDLGHVGQLFPEWRFESAPADLRRHPLAVIRSFNECDLIIDVTYGDSFSDLYIKRATLRDLVLKELAVRSRALYVLAPQTYGPFHNSAFRLLARDVLRHADRVYARDDRSAGYVNELSGVKAPVVQDMAFALPYTTARVSRTADTDLERAGVNVSGLLWRGGFEAENQFCLSVNYREYVRGVVQGLLEDHCEVVLVPHVIGRSQTSHDDDYTTCQALADEFAGAGVSLAPRFATCVDAKSFIAGLDFFTGARMHSTIAAYSTRVPVAPFSYSRKFEGVFEGLNYPYVVSGTTLSTREAVDMTLNLYGRRSELAQEMQSSGEALEGSLGRFAASIGELIK